MSAAILPFPPLRDARADLLAAVNELCADPTQRLERARAAIDLVLADPDAAPQVRHVVLGVTAYLISAEMAGLLH